MLKSKKKYNADLCNSSIPGSWPVGGGATPLSAQNIKILYILKL